MRIDIYRHTGKRFIAIPAGNPVPESWAGARFFKTIDLRTGDVRIGLGNATKILASIQMEGFAAI